MERRLDQPATYRITVQGHLDPCWSAWFDDMAIATVKQTTRPPTTTLIGTLVDQAALHGVLARIRDLGLLLLYVECVEEQG
jgi:hypothetical protein